MTYPNVEPYTPQGGTRRAFIVDVDGTVALLNGRDPYDQTDCAHDLPNWPVIEVIRSISTDRGWPLVFMSGRHEKSYSDTVHWLYRYVILPGYPWQLFMRADNDYRPDWQLKLELFNRHVRNTYHVVAAFDDRTQVVKLWRQLGITTFQVAEGNF